MGREEGGETEGGTGGGGVGNTCVGVGRGDMGGVTAAGFGVEVGRESLETLVVLLLGDETTGGSSQPTINRDIMSLCL